MGDEIRIVIVSVGRGLFGKGYGGFFRVVDMVCVFIWVLVIGMWIYKNLLSCVF